MSSRYRVSSGRAILNAKVVGEGDPVVFLHAAVTDSRMWCAQLDCIGANNMAVAYDRRGFGRTQAENEEFSSVADLLAVLDATARAAPAILVGCSQGGRIAIDAALMHPSRVRGLVLIAPNVTGGPEAHYPPEVDGILAQLDEAEKTGDFDRLSDIKARLWLDGPLATEGRVSGQARQLFRDMHSIVLQSPPVGTDTDITPNFHRLDEISAPSLTIWGDLDFPHIQDRCRQIVAAMLNGSGYEMPNAAHLPSLEQPAEVTSLLVKFVNRLSV